MDDNITYGVFWRSKDSLNPDKWRFFGGWYTEYEAAEDNARDLRRNSVCIAAKVVERVETYEDVPGTLWEREKDG